MDKLQMTEEFQKFINYIDEKNKQIAENFLESYFQNDSQNKKRKFQQFLSHSNEKINHIKNTQKTEPTIRYINNHKYIYWKLNFPYYVSKKLNSNIFIYNPRFYLLDQEKDVEWNPNMQIYPYIGYNVRIIVNNINKYFVKNFISKFILTENKFEEGYIYHHLNEEFLDLWYKKNSLNILYSKILTFMNRFHDHQF